jgi:hypothetical protein
MDRFGTKVRVRGGADKGSIEIVYYSMEDLDRVIELMMK